MESEAFYSSQAWLELRYLVICASDGCCSCCRRRATPNNPIHVDHIRPRSKYPHLELEISNLQVLCKACNLGKGATDETDWRLVPTTDLATLLRDPEAYYRGVREERLASAARMNAASGEAG